MSIIKPEVKAITTVKIVMMADNPTLSAVLPLVFPVAFEPAVAVSEAAWTRNKTSTTSIAT